MMSSFNITNLLCGTRNIKLAVIARSEYSDFVINQEYFRYGSIIKQKFNKCTSDR
jgi:hypothetical protein